MACQGIEGRKQGRGGQGEGGCDEKWEDRCAGRGVVGGGDGEVVSVRV